MFDHVPSIGLFAAVIAGVSSHSLLYAHREWHLSSPYLFRFYVASYLIILFSAWIYHGFRFGNAISRVTLIVAAYTVPLFSSMVVYRAFLHRLGNFPGPFLARLSKFWHVLNVLDSRNHLLLDELHHRYGDFVRTGKSNYETE